MRPIYTNTEIRLSDVRVGSVVSLRECFGMDAPVTRRVTGVEANIKNGRPGVTYSDRWAYLDQIDSVISF